MRNGSSVEVRIPSELGFEKVAMSTASSTAALMGSLGKRIEGPHDHLELGFLSVEVSLFETERRSVNCLDAFPL